MHGLRAHCALIFTTIGLASPLLLQASGLRVPIDNGLGVPGAAGGAALAIDASTGITNPAGLVRIQNPELVVAVDPAFTSTEFEGSSTIEIMDDTRAGEASGKLNVPLIAIHFSYPLKEYLVYGFSFNNPFGQSVNFPENSIVNTTVTEAMLITWNIANSLGYAINKQWSIGAGFDAQRLDFMAQNIFPIPTPTSPSIYTKNEAADWQFGWHGGVLYQFNEEQSRVGFNYRSQINHDAKGKSYASQTVIPTRPFFGPEATNRNFTVAFDLPPIYTLSAFHKVNEKWDVLGTVEFAQWNVYDAIEFTNIMNVPGGDKTVPQDYHNSWSLAAATYYHFNPSLYLGVGVRFDETPMSDDYRGVEFPDSDVWVLGFSGGYQFNKVVRLELGYSHSMFKEEHIDTYDPDSTVHNVGEGQLYGDVINTQLTINLAPVYGVMEQP
jgi:long-chain fatty acid transport protein